MPARGSSHDAGHAMNWRDRCPRILQRSAFLRFLVGGASTTLVSYAIYVLLLAYLPYLVAYAIAFAVGVVWSYFANTLFVFQRRPNVARAMAFPLVYAAQYVAGSAILFLLIDRWHAPEKLAPLAVVVLTLPITYLLSRWIITART